MNPALGALAVAAALGLGFLVLRWVRERLSPHPEILRKAMHVWMGFVTAAFPWLFDSPWPVVVLAGLSLAILLWLRSGVAGAGHLRGILHGVERASWGELLFPVAVATVFVLADNDPLLYSVPILILALADAVAALIGVYYGQIRFSTLEGNKSLEGSAAFFMVTFLCVHTAVLLFSDTGRAESLLIGVLMGAVVMLFEAVAWRGLDNLFIPLASFALLHYYLELDAAGLLLRLVVLVLLAAFLLLWRRHSTLDDSALIGAALVGYGAWALGGVDWLMVPVAAFVVATVAAARAGRGMARPIHTVHALLGIAGPGLAWLFLAVHSDGADLLFGYSIAFAAHVTMLAISGRDSAADAVRPAHLLVPVGQGLLIVLSPYVLTGGIRPEPVIAAAVGAAALGFTAFGFLRLQPVLETGAASPGRWMQQALIAGAVSLLAWLALPRAGGLN